MTATIKIFGVPEALRAFDELPRRVRFKHLRIALNAGGGIIKTRASQLARRETGLLSKSIGVKVKIPDASFNSAHHGKPAYAVIGPKRKSGRMMRLTQALRLKGYSIAQRSLVASRKELAGFGIHPLAREKTAVKVTLAKFRNAVYRNPTRYAHLVEKGTKRSRRFPFLAPAVQQTKDQVTAKIAEKLSQGIEQEAKLLVR